MTIPTVTMKAPATFGGVVSGTPSGTNYVVDAAGFIYSVPFQDIPVLSSLGFKTYGDTQGLIAEGVAVGTAATGFTPMSIKVPANQKFRVTKVSVFDASGLNTSGVFQITTASSSGTTLVASAGGAMTNLSAGNSVIDGTLTTAALTTILAAGTSLFVDMTTASGTASTTADFRVYGDILSIGE